MLNGVTLYENHIDTFSLKQLQTMFLLTQTQLSLYDIKSIDRSDSPKFVFSFHKIPGNTATEEVLCY